MVQLFSLKYITYQQWQLINDLCIGLLIRQAIISKILTYNKGSLFYTEAVLLTFIPFFSALPAYIFHGQNPLETFLAARPTLLMLFYFYVRKKEFSVDMVEAVLLNLGTIIAVIFIIQSYTFPNVLFQQIRIEDAFVDERGGIVRNAILDPIYMVFAMFLSANHLLKSVSIKSLLVLSICILGIFFTGTRQIIFSSIATLTLMFLFSFRRNSKAAFRILMVLSVFGAIFYLSGGARYLDSLITLTKDQKVTNDDYIRIQEFNYYFFTYMPSPLAYLIGNGYHYGNSAYGKEIFNLEEMAGLYRSDIGLIGALNMFGLIYIIPICSIFFKVFRAKLGRRTYYKFFFVYLIATAFTGGNYFYLPYTFTLIFLLLYNVEHIVERETKYNSPKEENELYEVAIN